MNESEVTTELLAAVKASPLPLARWVSNNTVRIRELVEWADNHAVMEAETGRSRRQKAANEAEEELLHDIANDAMREARKVTLSEGGNVGKKGQFRAADIVAAARSRIASAVLAIAPRGSARWSDLMLIDAAFYNEFKDLLATCERIENESHKAMMMPKGSATTQDALRTVLTISSGNGPRTINDELARLGFDPATLKDLHHIGGDVAASTGTWGLPPSKWSCSDKARYDRQSSLESHSYRRSRLGPAEWQKQRDAMVMGWIQQDLTAAKEAAEAAKPQRKTAAESESWTSRGQPLAIDRLSAEAEDIKAKMARVAPQKAKKSRGEGS